MRMHSRTTDQSSVINTGGPLEQQRTGRHKGLVKAAGWAQETDASYLSRPQCDSTITRLGPQTCMCPSWLSSYGFHVQYYREMTGEVICT